MNMYDMEGDASVVTCNFYGNIVFSKDVSASRDASGGLLARKVNIKMAGLTAISREIVGDIEIVKILGIKVYQRAGESAAIFGVKL